MSRASIIKKAYLCIDEVYPDITDQDIPAFNVEEFLDQAARLIIQIAPARTLGTLAVDYTNTDAPLISVIDGVGRIQLKDSFARLVSFQAEDWSSVVTEALDDTSPRYKQQGNPILRGTPHRPMVFITNGGKHLEYYTTKAVAEGASKGLEQFFAVCFDGVDDNYPTKLEDITAWKTAELVLSTMGDTSAATNCTNRVTEILQTL